MSLSLYDFLKKDVKKMIQGIGSNNAGNIYPLIIEEVERSVIDIVLRETNFNLVQTTKLLGISRCTLYRRVKKLGISTDSPSIQQQDQKSSVSNQAESSTVLPSKTDMSLESVL